MSSASRGTTLIAPSNRVADGNREDDQDFEYQCHFFGQHVSSLAPLVSTRFTCLMDILPRARSGSEALALGCAIYPSPCTKELVDKRVINHRVARELEDVVTHVAQRIGTVIVKSGLPPDAAIALMISLASSWCEEQELDRSAALALHGIRSSDTTLDVGVALDLVRRLRKRRRKLQA